MKICTECRQSKDDFEFQRAGKTSLQTKRCLKCRRRTNRNNRRFRVRQSLIIPPENYKQCTTCYKTKPIDVFIGGHVACMRCTQLHINRRKRAREYSEEIKTRNVCAICGETDPHTFQFDHVGPKKKGIARYGTINSIMVEIENTRILCANCHAVVTQDQRREILSQTPNAIRLRRKIATLEAHVNPIKLQRGCEYVSNGKVCGHVNLEYPQTLTFDHLDRNTKINAVSNMIRNRVSLEKIKTEIAKCRVLCQNCHQRWTRIQMGYHKYKDAEEEVGNMPDETKGIIAVE